jgi:hypothetical protein
MACSAIPDCGAGQADVASNIRMKIARGMVSLSWAVSTPRTGSHERNNKSIDRPI